MKSPRHRSPRPDTLKCVRMTYAPFPIKRLRNDEADKLVNGGMAVYVPKRLYRARVERLPSEVT